MNRREALYSVSMMFGGTIVGAQLFLEGCGSPEADQATKVQSFFTAEEVALLDEIGETILPAHDNIPGAKAVEIGKFMQTIVADCYSEEEQKIFQAGMKDLQAKSQAAYQQNFTELSPENRQALLTDLDAEAQAQSDTIPDAEKDKRDLDSRLDRIPPHYFDMMKQLTIWGFFSSKVGATEVLRYLEVPGKYDGSYPYKEGDRAWAPVR